MLQKIVEKEHIIIQDICQIENDTLAILTIIHFPKIFRCFLTRYYFCESGKTFEAFLSFQDVLKILTFLDNKNRVLEEEEDQNNLF